MSCLKIIYRFVILFIGCCCSSIILQNAFSRLCNCYFDNYAYLFLVINYQQCLWKYVLMLMLFGKVNELSFCH